jgi:branched-chain amino acid transport system permease protein
VISFFSLRVKAIFFAMVTLALAEYAHILGIQWYELTLGEDGISFELPWIFNSDWSAGHFLLAEIDDRLMIYYLILLCSVLLFMGLVRFVRSPLGRVLKSIRSNENRAVALGFKTFQYKTFAVVFGSTISSLAGVLFAMWLRYVNPDSVLGLSLMVNVLLMVLIGGLGTLHGSIIGVSFIIISETWLPGALKTVAGIFPQSEMITRLTDRWHLYFGILFILVIIFFPRGVVGTARRFMAQRKATMTRKRNVHGSGHPGADFS